MRSAGRSRIQFGVGSVWPRQTDPADVESPDGRLRPQRLPPVRALTRGWTGFILVAFIAAVGK
jgi:hypothetical protein